MILINIIIQYNSMGSESSTHDYEHTTTISNMSNISNSFNITNGSFVEHSTSNEKILIHNMLIAGYCSPGKTSFVKKLSSNRFMTMDIDFFIMKLDDDIDNMLKHQIRLWDMCGTEKQKIVWKSYVHNASHCIVVIDTTIDKSLMEAEEVCKLFNEYVKSIYVIDNKFSVGLVFIENEPLEDELLEDNTLIEGSIIKGSKMNNCINKCKEIISHANVSHLIISNKNDSINIINNFILDMTKSC